MADLAVLDVLFYLGAHALLDILSPRKLQCSRCAKVSSRAPVVDHRDGLGGCGFVVVVE